MIKYIFIGLSILCLFNITAHANPVSKQPTQHKDGIGFGLGALIGGLIAGPPGAIIGAAGGTWIGNKDANKDKKISSLEARLQQKQTELAYLQNEFSNRQSQYGKELQKVKLDKQFSALEEISHGVSLTVYFRTNQADIALEIIPRIERLANFLQEFPEIQLHLDAHADRRGQDYYNKRLSRRRAKSVETELVRAGLNNKRIHTHAYGESQALAAEGDQEGYVFDRRVIIHLTLDTEV